MDKAALRIRYRQERKLLTSVKDDSLLWNHICDLPEFNSSRTVASYYSYGDEPSTEKLNQQILKAGKKIALPIVQQDRNLTWALWDGNAKSLQKQGNLFVPKTNPIDPNEIDFVIVPCLHVNRSGYRLGQGGGSYDRALVGMKAFRIGLIYSTEITNEPLPIEAHDQKLDAVATPELIVRF